MCIPGPDSLCFYHLYSLIFLFLDSIFIENFVPYSAAFFILIKLSFFSKDFIALVYAVQLIYHGFITDLGIDKFLLFHLM